MSQISIVERHRLRAIGGFPIKSLDLKRNLVNTFEGEDPEGRDALLCENYLVIGEPAMRTIFTTGQVAKICKVAPRTVSKWFDSGRLRGYRIPGSQDRRIPREHLIRFLKEHGMPLGELEDEAMGKLLLVGVDPNVRGQILDLMPPEDYKIESAASGFEAGIQAESLHPDCVVIDFGMGRHEATLIAQNLRKNNEYADAVLVALLSDDDTASGFDRTPFNETFRKPFDSALLAERIRTLVGRKKQLA